MGHSLIADGHTGLSKCPACLSWLCTPHCPLCPAWVALTLGGVNGIQRPRGGICGLGGHMGCPVNWPSPEQCPAASLACSRSISGCVSQERSLVPGPPVRPPGFTIAAGLRPRGVVPGLQCPVCGVHGSLQGGPLSPCPPFSSGALLWAQSLSSGFSSLPTQLCGDGSLQPWCGGVFLLVLCVFKRWDPLMCFWGS